MARRRFHPPARAPSRAKEVSPSRQSPREPPRRRPKSPARAATSSVEGKRGFLTFPRGRAERALLALASLASKRAKATDTASCSPRAQPSPWAALTNAPLTTRRQCAALIDDNQRLLRRHVRRLVHVVSAASTYVWHGDGLRASTSIVRLTRDLLLFKYITL
jgi:hypothetical protein